MAREFSGQDLTILAYASSNPPRKIGTARFSTRTRDLTFTPERFSSGIEPKPNHQTKPTLTMPGTVDDFMNRFSGGGTIDDHEAQQYHDRFVSTQAADRGFDNQTYHQSATEYLGKLPDDKFQQAARNVYSQAAPQERQGLLGGLLSALGGGAAGDIAKKAGLGTTDPSQMSVDDAARLMNYARTEQPEVLQKTVQEKPWFVKAMGNPVVMGVLTMAAAKLLSGQRPKN